MNKTTNNIIESALMILSGGISIEMIETILGIIILVLDICWIIGKGAYTIYKKVKEKKYSDAIQAVKDTAEELEKYKDGVDDDNV